MQDPGQWEYDVAEEYCLKRLLNRPKAIVRNVTLFSSAFIVFTMLGTTLAHHVLHVQAVLLVLPQPVRDFTANRPILALVLLYILVLLLSTCACSRVIVILAIQLYQRYAPDHVRRRCLFMPTCSEYGIMAVRKHGAVIGLYKTYDRLINRCRGTIYRIDYP